MHSGVRAIKNSKLPMLEVPRLTADPKELNPRAQGATGAQGIPNCVTITRSSNTVLLSALVLETLENPAL